MTTNNDGKNFQPINYYLLISELSLELGYKSINDFAINGLKYKSSEKINRLKKANTQPSLNLIKDIAKEFPHVNLYWLVHAKGPMLLVEKTEDNVITFEEKVATEIVKCFEKNFANVKLMFEIKN